MDHWRSLVVFDAFAVGMRAKVGPVDQIDIDHLVAKAEQLLGSSDELTRAIMRFATQYQICQLDRAVVAQLGEELSDYAQSQTYVLNARERRDIDG